MQQSLITIAYIAASALSIFCCKSEASSPPLLTQEPKETQAPPVTVDDPILLDDIFVNADELSFESFRTIKRARKVDLGHPLGLIDISYAVLENKGRVIARFDGSVYFGLGNSVDFGLFSFLGKQSKQVLISQRVPRGGAHWIADVSSDGRVIFDSTIYEVGREDFQVIDLNKDGIFEILLPVTRFYVFGEMGMAETPLPIVIFKYNPKLRKYFPANDEFIDYSLKGIEERIKGIDPNDPDGYLSRRLEIVLDLIYAGKENEAWIFFEREYHRPDKRTVKAEIKNRIRDGGAYRYIYRNASKGLH